MSIRSKYREDLERSVKFSSIKQWYSGTFIKYLNLKEPNGYEVGFVNEVVSQLDTDILFRIDSLSNGMVEVLYSDMQLADYPDLGYINHDYFVAWLARLPIKQWKRGLTKDAIHISNPLRDELLTISESSSIAPKFVDLAKSIYYNEYATVDECFSSVVQGDTLGRAFNPNWALLVKKGRKYPMLGYKSMLVGYVDSNLVAHLHTTSRHLEEPLRTFMEVNVYG